MEMRVLIISDVSARMRGGVPVESRALSNGLQRRGHIVALATDQSVPGDPGLHYRISLPVGPSFGNEVQHALEHFKPDMVHVLCMNSKGVLQLAPILRDHPWVLTMHSIPPYERKLFHLHGHERLHYSARALRFLPNSLAWRWIFQRRIVPTIIVHSNFVKDIALAHGASADAVKVIPLFFEAASHSPTSKSKADDGRSPFLVTVGGFAHTKGQHDVVKTLPGLSRRFPRLRYQMIGEIRDPSYLAYLRRLAAELKVADHMDITPDLSELEKRNVLEQADIYIQPSHEEGFCLAYAEAAAIVPRLVGTHAGAIPALSNDDPGARVVAIRSPHEIMSAVFDLMRETLSAEHMCERLARLNERFSIAQYLLAHEGIYLAAQNA